jgi:predicted CxxxxCH...CXXCH cytochrome family protein
MLFANQEQTMNRSVIKSLVIGALCLIHPMTAAAVDPPHDPGNGYTCSSCHTTHESLGSTGYNNVCLTCHSPGDPKAGTKPFSQADFANPFNSYTSIRPDVVYQTSHSWNGPDANPAAGAQPPLFPAMTSNGLRARTGSALSCVRCHNQHSNANRPFLRMANDRDQMCLDCHRVRNTTDHARGTHPVNFNYTGASSLVKVTPGLYVNPPLNSNPGNPTSAMKLNNGVVLCTTCHAVHFADSNSATFDNNSGYNLLQQADGFLLRTDLHGVTANATNICTNCHAGKVDHNSRNQNVQCGDCHAGHVDTGDGSKPNVWLVRRFMNVSTSYGYKLKNQLVFFQSTSARNYKDANGTGVCQGCHDVPVGVGYPVEHGLPDTQVCNTCHSHGTAAGSFSAVAGKCDSCHGYPPQANVAGGPRGYAAGSPFTNESTSAHIAHAGGSPYSKQCVECHQGSSHLTGTYTDVFIAKGPILSKFPTLTPTYAAATFICTNVYCHSNGAPRGGTLVTLVPPAWNTGRGQIVGTPAECNACHGSDPATLTTNAHKKHLDYAFGCISCHSATVANVAGSPVINNPVRHVNGDKDILFSGFTSANRGVWSTTAATCTTIYCHSTVQGAGGNGAPAFAAPIWTGGPLACGACHADMATSAAATGSHIRHAQPLQTGMNIGCSVCHGAGYSATTIVTASHTNKLIDMALTGVAATNGSTPSYYQGTNPPGGGYAYCQNTYCHSTVQGAAGKGSGAPTSYAVPNWGSAPLICGSCHVDMRTSAAATGSHALHANTAGNGQYACSTCHNGAGKDPVTGSVTGAHANGVINLAFTTPAQLPAPAVQGAVYSKGLSITPGSGYATATCSNTTCHGAGAPAWGADTATPSCDKCHTFAASLPFKSTAGATVKTDVKAGAHSIHLASASATDPLGGAKIAMSSNLSCTDCHSAVATINQAGHLDTVVGAEINFGTLAKTGGLTSAYTAGQCTNVYCHGAGLPASSPARTDPVWNTPFLTGSSIVGNGSTTSGSGDCSRCHSYPPLNATHAGKVATDCNGCHNHVNTAGTGFDTPSLHINGTVDVSGTNHSVPYYSHNNATPLSSCTACHNTSNSATVTYPAVPVGSAPNCRGCHVNLAADATTIAVGTCTSCHAKPPNGSAAPNRVGSHAKHGALTNGQPDNCAICHSGAGSGSNANHGNSNRNAITGSVNVVFTAAQAGSTVWVPGTKSCNTITCHGGGSATWGVALNCQDCHGVTGSADVDNFALPFTTASPIARVRIDGEWNTTGHGKASGFYPSGNIAAAFTVINACEYCHDPAIAHNAVGNPFRLRNIADPFWEKNGVCMNCHATSSAGVSIGGIMRNASRKVGAYHYGASHQFGGSLNGTGVVTGETVIASGGQFCWDCHDTHGDSNAFMIHNQVATKSDPSTGAPQSLATATFTLSTPITGTDYADGTPTTGSTKICNTCHTVTGHYRSTSGDGHNAGTRCTVCHTHNGDAPNTAFKPPAGGVTHSVPYDTHKADIVAAGGNTACLGCHVMGTAASAYPAAVAGNPPDCMSCHKKAAPLHTGTTAGANCSSCHGTSTAAAANFGRPTGTAYPDRIGFHGGAQDGAHGTAACTVCHSGIGTSGGSGSGINHGKGSTAGPVRNGKPNVVGPMVNGITPTNSAKGVGIPAGGTTCNHGTISGSCSGGGTKSNSW